MTRDEIYGPSDAIDIAADVLQARADEVRDKAKHLRWTNAPAWANCIVSPSKRGLDGLRLLEAAGVRPACDYPGAPQSKDDWRWASRTMFGWFVFDEHGEVRSAVDAGNWTIEEHRP